MRYCIEKGLDLKLAGAAAQEWESWQTPACCYIHPSDFKWLIPRLSVQEGDAVEIGTPLFHDKDDERIEIVSPVNGIVKQIVRGEKRHLRAVVVETSNPQISSKIDFSDPGNAEEYRLLMLQHGLWPLLRQRPYSTIPNPDVKPKAVFVSCFDSAPLAPDYAFMMKGREEDFHAGIQAVQVVADAPMHLCMHEGTDNEMFDNIPDVEKHYFSGPHPAGNVGTQIHRIAPLSKGDVVWYISPMELAIIGHFFRCHELSFGKTVAITGPCVQHPDYVNMVYGADLTSLLQERISDANARKISGNILTGQVLDEYPSVRFHDHQITAIEEGGQREFLGWLLPGIRKWSLSHTFLSWLTPKREYRFNTSLHGGRRTFMMTDVYEKVFPFDILPLQLLKSCAIKDIEQMEALGIYEVEDEDFALCEVVCPSKIECQKIVEEAMKELRDNS